MPGAAQTWPRTVPYSAIPQQGSPDARAAQSEFWGGSETPQGPFTPAQELCPGTTSRTPSQPALFWGTGDMDHPRPRWLNPGLLPSPVRSCPAGKGDPNTGAWVCLRAEERPDSTLESAELGTRRFPAPRGDLPGETSAAAPASAHTLVAPGCQRKL